MNKQEECNDALYVLQYIAKAVNSITDGDLVITVQSLELKAFKGLQEFFNKKPLEEMVKDYIQKNITQIMKEAFQLLLERNNSLLVAAKEEAQEFLNKRR